jgi:hypothetical protein
VKEEGERTTQERRSTLPFLRQGKEEKKTEREGGCPPLLNFPLALILEGLNYP